MAITISQGETLQLAAKADPTATVTFLFAGASVHTITATQDTGDGTVFTVTQDTTSWAVGAYVAEVRQNVASVVTVLERFPLTILPIITSLPAGADVRTPAEIAVANIEAMISGGATLEAKSYKINNRELERYSLKELRDLLAYWKRRVASERRKAMGNNGLAPRIESYA